MKDKIKILLNEVIFDKASKKQMDLLDNFLIFACDYLKLNKPNIKIQFNRKGLVTTASYGGNNISVYGKDRALVDILRSIAHEMVHMKQDAEGNLEQIDHEQNNAAGSPIENEANAKAGVMIRMFGEKYPEIYE